MSKTPCAVAPRWGSGVRAGHGLQFQDHWERLRSAIPRDIAPLPIPASIRVCGGRKPLQIGEAIVDTMRRKHDKAIGARDLLYPWDCPVPLGRGRSIPVPPAPRLRADRSGQQFRASTREYLLWSTEKITRAHRTALPRR